MDMTVGKLAAGVVALGWLIPSTLARAEGEYGVLVDRPGVEETFAFCTACHSERIIAQQGLTRDGWAELFVWMREDQGMGEIPEPERTRILDYLSKHYGPDRPNFPN